MKYSYQFFVSLALLLVFNTRSYLGASTDYTFGFEESTLSNQWAASDGQLSLNSYRYQQGVKSLQWETSAAPTASMTLTFSTPYPTASASCYFSLYNSAALVDGRLKIEFLNPNQEVVREAIVQLNFQGWREFSRSYALDFSRKNTADNIAMVRFTIKNPSARTHTLLFDDFDAMAETQSTRFFSDWMALDYAQLTPSITSGSLLEKAAKCYPNPFDLSSSELQSISTIKGRLPVLSPSSTVLTTELNAAISYVASLNLTRNPDLSISGPSLLKLTEKLTTTELLVITRRLEVLAAGANTQPTHFNNYLDYILDQGILQKTVPLASNSYSNIRLVAQQFGYLISKASTSSQRDELCRTLLWIMSYGQIYERDYLYAQNSDIIYNYLLHYIRAVVNMSNPVEVTRELSAIRRYLEQSTEYTPGDLDILKPDGTGFHHGTHYNNYMYCYTSWINALYYLRGTSFRVSLASYERLRKAVISMGLMSTRGSTIHSLSMSGRNPWSSGSVLQFSSDHLQRLVAVGGDLYGTNEDAQLASFYNYLYSTNYYANVPNDNFDRFYAFNYSPAGVYRYGAWMAVMRSPTTKFFGAEIYSNKNRFGRYQSNGTLEVLYNNKSQLANGMPPNASSPGWDWNIVPGGTSVIYTSWAAMTPAGNLTQRFDQYSRTKNFSGALSWGDCGVFAADFDQVDSWGVTCFAATNLTFRKSVFAFDGKLIALGSDISSTDVSNTGATVTGLFQSYKPLQAPVFGRGNIPKNSSLTQEAMTTPTWILSPEGTGFYLPSDPANQLSIYYGNQSAPLETGSDLWNPGSAEVAKAYINHGKAPTSASYEYVVVPATNSAEMSSFTQEWGSKDGAFYNVLGKTSSCHALYHKPTQTYAYSFFEATSETHSDRVLEVGSEMLLMHRSASSDQLDFAVSNPNLRPQQAATNWVSTPTSTFIVVQGAWYLSPSSSKNIVVETSEAVTIVRFTLTDGEPLYFSLSSSPLSARAQYSDLFSATLSESGLLVSFNRIENSKRVSLYNSQGMLLHSQFVNPYISSITIPLSFSDRSLLTLHVEMGSESQTKKFLI